MSVLDEETEDAGMKLIQLEEKTNKLENAIAEISKETRAVLVDVRTILTDLENPMNYLKGLGIDEVMLSMAENITEKKLKDFMEKRLETLVRTVVEGKLKEMVDGLIAKFINEQVGSIIEGKIRELKEKGILKIPIDVDELKSALNAKLTEAISSGVIRGELEESVQKSVKAEIEKLAKESSTLQESLKSEFEKMLKNEVTRIKEEISQIDQSQSQSSPVPKAKNEQDRKPGERNRPEISLVGLTACAGALMQIFGRRGAERAIDDHYRMGSLTEETRSSLLRIMCTINVRSLPEENEGTVADHMTANFLFEKLANGGSDLDFLMVHNLVNSMAISRNVMP